MMNEQTRNTPCTQLTGTMEPPWHAAMAVKGPGVVVWHQRAGRYDIIVGNS